MSIDAWIPFTLALGSFCSVSIIRVSVDQNTKTSKLIMNSNTQNLEIFIQAPDLQIPTRALTLTPNLTIRNLKLSFLSQISSIHQTLVSSSFLTVNGRLLSDSDTVENSGVTSLSTLSLRFRLSGGGGDGGATGAESRDCYLNMYAEKKPDKCDPNEQRLSKWLNCALSNEPLKHPIVVDYLGNLFNKQPLVEALLMKKLPKAFSHIKGLKDMIAVELAAIPGSDSPSSGDVKFQCPITGMEFNDFAESDKIVINGNEEEVILLREKMEIEKMKLREKKVKKVKNGETGVCDDGVKLSGTKHGIVDLKGPQKVSGKIETNGKDVNGLKANGKRFKAGDSAPAHANKEVYASIFTSSRKSEFKETYSCRSLPLGRN
ncbi:unnamed protein product [Lactuca virosa]|uniref:Ubiquitin-like domain-containing protein n=1 Tax=Lactuca virosa TaxID=75947 RepID=A0AAU9MHG1_9ASTR|nr:unnamed protein product [Lactuca virosa]